MSRSPRGRPAFEAEGPSLPRSGLLWLGILLVLGGALRFTGLWFGRPFDLRPDESMLRVLLARMDLSGDPNPNFHHYPGLVFYSLFAYFKALHVGLGILGMPSGDLPFPEFLTHAEIAARAHRFLSAASGTATIAVTFLLGCRVRSGRAGLLAAALLAATYAHVRESHFGTVDVPAALFVSVALLAVVRAERTGTASAFGWAGAWTGVASAFRYSPAVLCLSILVAHASVASREGKPLLPRLLGRRLWIAALASLGAFLLLSPYTLLEWEPFRRTVLSGRVGPLGASDTGFDSGLRVHLGISLRYGFGLPLLVLAVLGGLASVRRTFRRSAILVAFVLPYFAILASDPLPFVRYVVPLAPALAVLGASGIEALAQGLRPSLRRFAAPALLLVAIVDPLSRSIASDRLFLRETSYERLLRWFRENDAPATRVAFSDRMTASRFAGACRLVPFDPPKLAHGEEVTDLVVARHPARAFEAPVGIERILDAAESVRIVHETRALRGEAWTNAVFEPTDRFYYPNAGFAGVDHAGPDITVYRLVPRRGSVARPQPLPPPRDLEVLLFGGKLNLTWKPPSGAVPLGYYLRITREGEDPSAPPWALLPMPANVPSLGFGPIPPGRYLVSVSSVDTDGEGMSSEAIVIVVE